MMELTGRFVRARRQCSRCLRFTGDLVAHHILPVEYGGSDEAANLRPLCRVCHPTVEQEDKAAAEAAGFWPISQGLAGQFARRRATYEAVMQLARERADRWAA